MSIQEKINKSFISGIKDAVKTSFNLPNGWKYLIENNEEIYKTSLLKIIRDPDTIPKMDIFVYKIFSLEDLIERTSKNSDLLKYVSNYFIKKGKSSTYLLENGLDNRTLYNYIKKDLDMLGIKSEDTSDGLYIYSDKEDECEAIDKKLKEADISKFFENNESLTTLFEEIEKLFP